MKIKPQAKVIAALRLWPRKPRYLLKIAMFDRELETQGRMGTRDQGTGEGTRHRCMLFRREKHTERW